MNGFLANMLDYAQHREEKYAQEAREAAAVHRQLQKLHTELEQLSPELVATLEKARKKAIKKEEKSQRMQSYVQGLKGKKLAHAEASANRSQWEEQHAVKSDIWSFGCVFAELLNHGDFPLEPLSKGVTDESTFLVSIAHVGARLTNRY